MLTIKRGGMKLRIKWSLMHCPATLAFASTILAVSFIFATAPEIFGQRSRRSQSVIQDGVTAIVERKIPLGLSTGAQAAPSAVDPNSVYSNITTDSLHTGVLNGGAGIDPSDPANVITKLLADDLHLAPSAGAPPYAITGFRFTVANFGGFFPPVRPLVRFYANDGAGGGPGTLIAGFNFDPVTVGPGSVVTFVFNPGTTQLTIPNRDVWMGIAFDNDRGATGANTTLLNNFGVGVRSPVDRGSSADLAWRSATNGPFTMSNPAGDTINTSVPDNYGWELLQATPPLAVGVRVSGKVMAPTGRGVTGARIALADAEGTVITATTNRLGQFVFDDVPSGRTYVLTASSRRFSFEPASHVISVTDDLGDLNFIASPLQLIDKR